MSYAIHYENGDVLNFPEGGLRPVDLEVVIAFETPSKTEEETNNLAHSLLRKAHKLQPNTNFFYGKIMIERK